MKIGMVTDSLSNLSFKELLETAAGLNLDSLEFATGNWSNAPHLDLDGLLARDTARVEFLAALRDHGLGISALNANGNQLHPSESGAEQASVVRKTVELASLLGVERVNLMSGLPEAPGDSHPNWIVAAWPPETTRILEWQWKERVIPYWTELVGFAGHQGVGKLCLELHGSQVVYNVPTLLRLRDAVGETVGANLDPSHLFWMGADPLAVVRRLGAAGALYHVHAKDTMISAHRSALTGRLDTLPMHHVAERAWSYVTLGYGHGEEWWRRFCYELRLAGYDDVLSIEHEDATLSRLEGVRKSVELLRAAALFEPSDYQLPDL